MSKNKRLYIVKDDLVQRYSHYFKKYVRCTDFITLADCYNELFDENEQLKKENKILYDENIQLRNKLLHFIQLKDDVKYLEEKGVF